jgi:hypothetical protein
MSSSDTMSEQCSVETAHGAPVGDLSPAALTFVPNSSIQFLDLKLSEVDGVRVRRRFFEEETGDGPALHVVALDGDNVRHPLTGEPVDAGATYSIDGNQALKAYLDAWLPIPYLRATGLDEDGSPVLDEGPTNWARLFITHSDQHDGRRPGYRIVLAFDTAVESRAHGAARTYAAPLEDDVAKGSTYRFSDDEASIAGFVSEPWVDDWLGSVYRDHMVRRSAAAGEEEWSAEGSLEHLAHYLTLLTVLADSLALPPVRFLDPSAHPDKVLVDVVLDLGTSRTCALLSERDTAGSSERGRVSMLPLRDLSEPWRVQSEIFSSRIQFAKAAFGSEAWSRWSGRTNAFFWPSLARVGAEAERLAATQPYGEDWTGLSSPMHYIWDEQPAQAAWRFACLPGEGAERAVLISGLQLVHLSEMGDVLGSGERRGSATKPRFSRSSLTTFFAAELIVQALSAMHAPANRTDGRLRALGRVVLTIPSSLAPHERLILKKRVEGAVALVWRSLGFIDGEIRSAPALPEVLIASDNATNAGLAYIHNELGFKFKGKAREYLDLMGKQRPDHRNGRSLRLASLDIGGGGACLSIATYELSDSGALIQTPQISDGCRTGGADVLKAIVERHLMPALERRLIECKLPTAKRFLERVICGRGGKRGSRGSEFGRRFASEIAYPLAISMLETHLGSRALANDVPIERSLDALVSIHAPHAKAVLDELDELASDEGADTFAPHEIVIGFRDRDIAFTIKSVLDPVLANVCRVVQAFDCDVLLVSGWAARLPAVIDTLVERMPSQPNRIVPLSDYRVAEWYTSRERSGTIGDSKSAAAMGALLASAATVAGLPLTQRTLDGDAGRLHVGRMSDRGLVANDTVMFVLGEAAGSGAQAKDARTCTLSIEPPVLLGGRRIALENWPATPLFWLDHEPADHRSRTRGPLKVTIERVAAERGQPETLRIVRACDVDGNNLAPSEMALRLQTLRSPDGHWLDTGAIAIE